MELEQIISDQFLNGAEGDFTRFPIQELANGYEMWNIGWPVSGDQIAKVKNC